MLDRKEILQFDLRRGKKLKLRDSVAVDKPVNIFVNGEHFVVLIASPRNLRELAVGHLLGAGVISGLADVTRVSLRGVNVYVETRREVGIRGTGALRVIPTACGSPEDFAILLKDLRPLKQGQRFSVEEILDAFRTLQLKSRVYRRTGGVHAAALASERKLRFIAEDVGRHNAVDKVVGWGLLRGLDFSRSFVISSGRLSADIVMKCLRAGIPLLASKSAPLSSGILGAELGGLTLVGFARGARINVYTHPERLQIRRAVN